MSVEDIIRENEQFEQGAEPESAKGLDAIIQENEDFESQGMPRFGPSVTATRTYGTGEYPVEAAQTAGRLAVQALPYVGATAASILAPQGLLATSLYAALGGAGGQAIRGGLETTFEMPGAPEGMSEYGKDILTQGALQGGTELVGGAVTRALGKLISNFAPRTLYQSSLKPPPSSPDVPRMISSGMREGIEVSEKGLAQVEAKIRRLEEHIEEAIQVDPSAQIAVEDVFSRLNQLKDKWRMLPGEVAAIKKVEDDLRKTLPATVSGAEAQQLKRRLYELVRMANSQAYAKTVSLNVEAQKQIARGLKEELEIIYDIGDYNAKMGDMIELEKALTRFVNREGNKQVTSYFGPVLATVAGGVSESVAPGTGLRVGLAGLSVSLIRNALEDPSVKSSLAIILARAGNKTAARALAKGGKYIPASLLRASEFGLEQGMPQTLTVPSQPR